MDETAGSDKGPKKTDGIEFDWRTVEPKPVVKPLEPAPVDKVVPGPTVKPQSGSGIPLVRPDLLTPALSTRIAPGLDNKIAGVGATTSLLGKPTERTTPGQIQFDWKPQTGAQPLKPADQDVAQPPEFRAGGGAGAPKDWRTAQPTDVQAAAGAPPKTDWRIPPKTTDVPKGETAAPKTDWRIPPQPTDVPKLGGAGAPKTDWRIPPQPADVPKLGGAGAPTDKVAISDRPAAAARPGLAELSYNDPDFDKKLWAGNYNALRITDLPQDVKVSSWVDKNGFFLFYKNGNDDRKPHYLPPSVRTIEANSGVRNADELRLQAQAGARLDKNPVVINFEKVYGRENPLVFAQRMGGIGTQALADLEVTLRKEVVTSPNDPMAHFLLSDVLLGQAFKPIIEQVTSGSDVIKLKNPYTDQRLDEAIKERQTAMDIMKREKLSFPNPPVIVGRYDRRGDIEAQLGLYPNWWGDLQLKVLKSYIDRMPVIELPPILPPR